jgi:hypothetical protein
LYNILHHIWHYIPLTLSRVKHPLRSERRLDHQAIVE